MGNSERERGVDWRLVLRLLFLQYPYRPVTDYSEKIILKLNREKKSSKFCKMFEPSVRRGEKAIRIYFVHMSNLVKMQKNTF